MGKIPRTNNFAATDAAEAASPGSSQPNGGDGRIQADSHMLTLNPPPRQVAVELALGLAPEDAMLRLASGSRRQDLQPWLLDAVAVRIKRLGHHDEVPRPWDWENVLTLLEPGEELLYVLDHRASQKEAPFELWLAIRFPPAAELDESTLELRNKRARVVISQIHRQAFPGSSLDWIDPKGITGKLAESRTKCVVVTGMPSPRSLDDSARDIDRETATRNFQSLNDVVEPLYDLNCDYRIAFVVQRVGNRELETELAQKTALYDRVHPLVEIAARKGENWSSNWSKNRTFAEAVGESINEQVGTSKSRTINPGPAGAVAGAAIGLIAGPPGTLVGAALGSLAGILAGIVSFSKSESKSTSTGRTWTHTTTTGETVGESSGVSLDATAQHVNSLLRLADRSLERTIDALHEATGTGGFRWGAFAFADNHNADIVGRSLMGVLAGSRTKDHPLVRFRVDGEIDRLLSSRTPTMEIIAEAAPILSLPRVCDALLVPEADLPGLQLSRNVFFGRHVTAAGSSDGVVALGPDAFSAGDPQSPPHSISIPYKDLFRHVLVAGTTGAGKTMRVVDILNGIRRPGLSVVVFETAKRTYRGRLQRKKPEDEDRTEGPEVGPIVYNLGNSTSFGNGSRFRPLRINPFYFEFGTSLKRHIAILSDALAELMPTEAMIGPLLRRAVEACYTERGWDIERARPVGDKEPAWPTVIDFVVQVRALAEGLNYGPEVNANYRGALESRASLLLDATFQDIFGYGGNTPIDKLFPADRDAIVEVEDLPPSDVDIRAFVMTLLLSRLRSVQGERRRHDRNRAPSSGEHERMREVVDEDRRWLLVIEEAHNVLDRQFEQRRPTDESNAGRTLLRTVVRLLQEGREMGIGMMVIDQAPTRLARDVIGNTGTKIVMRLEDADEMAEIGRAMGLEEDAWPKLGFLEVGEALIKTPYMDRPAKSAAVPESSPVESRPEGEGRAPSFAVLAALWNPVLTGRGSEPNDRWLGEVIDAAGGDLHLVLFAGLRSLLMEHGYTGGAADAAGLRRLLASPAPARAALMNEAWECWAETCRAYYSDELIAVALAICSSLAPSPVWRRKSISTSGMYVAADLLERAGFGAADEWRLALAQMGEGVGMRALANLTRNQPNGDRSAPVRALLAATYDVTQWHTGVLPPEPLELVFKVRIWLADMLRASDGPQMAQPVLSAAPGWGGGAPADARTDAEALIGEVRERLTLQVAGHWGSAYVAQVNSFLMQEAGYG